MIRITKPSAILGLAAALAMTATPAVAAELPAQTRAVSDWTFATDAIALDDTADRHRHRRYRRDRGVDAGDVLAGVVILGGIAAIASAATKNRDRDYRQDDYRYRDYRTDRGYDYRDSRNSPGYDSGSGMDSAVDMCVDAIERDTRVDSVDSADRLGTGWTVSGTLFDGGRFTCRIGNDGRISDIEYGTGNVGYGEPYVDNQWSDESYRQARANVGYGQPDVASEPSYDAQPAYPGGPVDGDLVDGGYDY